MNFFAVPVSTFTRLPSLYPLYVSNIRFTVQPCCPTSTRFSLHFTVPLYTSYIFWPSQCSCYPLNIRIYPPNKGIRFIFPISILSSDPFCPSNIHFTLPVFITAPSVHFSLPLSIFHIANIHFTLPISHFVLPVSVLPSQRQFYRPSIRFTVPISVFLFQRPFFSFKIRCVFALQQFLLLFLTLAVSIFASNVIFTFVRHQFYVLNYPIFTLAIYQRNPARIHFTLPMSVFTFYAPVSFFPSQRPFYCPNVHVTVPVSFLPSPYIWLYILRFRYPFYRPNIHVTVPISILPSHYPFYRPSIHFTIPIYVSPSKYPFHILCFRYPSFRANIRVPFCFPNIHFTVPNILFFTLPISVFTLYGPIISVSVPVQVSVVSFSILYGIHIFPTIYPLYVISYI